MSEVGIWIFLTVGSEYILIFVCIVNFVNFISVTCCYKDYHKRPIGAQMCKMKLTRICFWIWPWMRHMQSVYHLQLLAFCLKVCQSKETKGWEVLTWRNHPSGFFSGKSRAQLGTKFISWELLLIHENSWTEADARRRKIVCTANDFFQYHLCHSTNCRVAKEIESVCTCEV